MEPIGPDDGLDGSLSVPLWRLPIASPDEPRRFARFPQEGPTNPWSSLEPPASRWPIPT